MTNIKLHGLLGDFIGKKEYNLSIKSVSEAIHAINVLSGKRLYPFLQVKDRENVKYQILINGRSFETDRELLPENLEDIRNSELCLKNPNIKNTYLLFHTHWAENQGWDIHRFCDTYGVNKNEILTATKENGKTVYTSGFPF